MKCRGRREKKIKKGSCKKTEKSPTRSSKISPRRYVQTRVEKGGIMGTKRSTESRGGWKDDRNTSTKKKMKAGITKILEGKSFVQQRARKERRGGD